MLHPKEVAYLQKQKQELAYEILAIEKNIPYIEAEIAQLRAIGTFPEDIAARYRLTVDGLPKRSDA